MLRILADNSDGTLPFDDFALFTHWFYGRSNLHFKPPFRKNALIAHKSPHTSLLPCGLDCKNYFILHRAIFVILIMRYTRKV